MALLLVGTMIVAGLGVGTYLLIGTAGPGREQVALTTIRTGTLSYDVPAEWMQGDEPLDSSLGLDFAGVARGPAYECGGQSFLRGVVASTVVSSPVPAESVASTTARVLAAEYYVQRDGAAPAVAVGPARSIDVGGVPASLVEATAVTGTDDGCLATDGVVKVLAVPLGSDGVAVLVVNGDVAGGPAGAPPNPDPATLDAIVASARLIGT